MTEIGVGGARGDDQIVVRQLAVREHHSASGDVHGGRLAEQDGGVLLPPQDPSDRHGDVARVESRRGDLVQQRLEQVVVAPIDQGQTQRRAPQRPCGVQAPETASEDHHVREHGRRGHGTGLRRLKAAVSGRPTLTC